MINTKQFYESMSNMSFGDQKKITVQSCLEVFFGYDFEGNLRLSFLSKQDSPNMESTNIIKVVRVRETSNLFWTSFDLVNLEYKDAYFSFCDNLIDSVENITDEKAALKIIKRRFLLWKKLFKNSSRHPLSQEELMGLFGELYVLKNRLTPLYGSEKSVKAWGGSDLQSKDFTIDNTWYEVKTIGTSKDEIHISSLAQLSSENAGHLAVVCVEEVSMEYTAADASISEITNEILDLLDDEELEELLLEKVQKRGIDLIDDAAHKKFCVKNIFVYSVVNEFPRLTENNLPFSEITNVSYIISLSSIKRFKEE